MNFKLFSRVCRIAAIGAILLGSASCVYINEELGQNLMPTDQKWDVFTPEPAVLENIQLELADSLSAYSSTRFTFGSINDPTFGTSISSTSFTLVPAYDSIDFGENIRVRQFHLSAVRDTLSTYHDNQQRILQNVYVSELKAPLDTFALYTGTFMSEENRQKYLNTENRITAGIPVYDGGDSLSFDFSIEFSKSLIGRLQDYFKADVDSMDLYLKNIPGIFITTDAPATEGGRINMFDLEIESNTSGYITGNYAELKLTSDYGERKDVDTSFVFYFGPADFRDPETSSLPSQFAFNTCETDEKATEIAERWDSSLKEKLYIAGSGGVKPVITAREIKEIVTKMLNDAGIIDHKEVVINKATIMLPYEMPSDYLEMEKFPQVLSPTVRLRSEEGKYITYAGLTDSSVASEDQGDINRSTCMYTPDISHHVQQILNLDEKADIDNYDIWMLIMRDEVVAEDSSNNEYNDYYNSLLYSSYYNNMMYGGYGGYGGYGYGYPGYGYGGYGYGGYGYGGYGYGYDNYYNYMMMAAMSNSYSTSETSERSLDKDRFYCGVLNGPGAAGKKPSLKITFSAPKTAER